ncbi:MAG: DUF4355 domain-containing protein [Muribaculaceae bacterium]|nr:DUF4355 domain-containing protein [Muribaculaceae bacterium]
MTDETTQTEQTFTQADIDSLKAQHQEEMNNLAGKLRAEFKEKEKQAKAEAERIARQANMTELEKARADLEELQSKYQQSQDTIALTAQKDETRKLMSELGVDVNCLDYVFVPKDMEATKARTKAFKEYIDGVKKETFESNVQSKAPSAGGVQTGSNVDINNAIRAGAGY